MEGNDVEEWLEDMFAKVGGMWSDLRQAETVNYVESRVQTIGTDAKSFCSEFIQEVFSSSPAQTQTTTDPVVDIPLVQITETEQCINSTEGGVSNEIPSVEMTVKKFEECISVKEETSGNIDVPASFDYSSYQSTLTENLGVDGLVLPSCRPETSTCDLEDVKISTSFSERDFEIKECIDTTNHFVFGDCENEECLDTLNSRACGTGHPVLNELRITDIPNAASSSELVDVSAGNLVLSEWDFTGSGSSEEAIEHETMLDESCIMMNPYRLKLQRKPGLRVSMIKDGDSIPEPKADESSGGGGHSTRQLEMLLPLAQGLEEQDWEIV